jgi:hypothetical protein
MKSEVEKNQKLINVNDVLIYCDHANFQKWIVTEIFDGGFEAKDDYETKDFYFNMLQTGWSISVKTKKENELYLRYKYEA